MGRQSIFVGTNANDGTGDDLRTAMQKINDNFVELYGTTTEANDLVEDITPQLGGNLDTQSFIITTSTANGNITLTPNGTGSVVAGSLKINGTTLSSDDSSKITLAENVDILNALNVTGTINSPRIETNTIDSYDSSVISILRDTNILGNLSVNSINSNDSSQILINDSVRVSGNLTVDNVNSTQISTDGIDIINNEISASRSNDDLVLNGSGTGQVRIGGYRFPTGDGSAGQVLTTNGAGQLYFSSSSGGGSVTFRDSTSTSISVTTNTFTFIGTQGITATIDNDVSNPSLTIAGPDLSSYITNTVTGPLTVDNITLNDNIISTSSNADLVLSPGGTGRVVLNRIASDDSSAVEIEDALIVSSLGDAGDMLYVGANKQISSTDFITFDTANNRVGIGHTTSSPQVRLDIIGETTNTAQIRLGQHSTDSDGPDISLRKSRGSYGTPAVVSASDSLGKITAFSYGLGDDGSTIEYTQSGNLGWDATSSDADSSFLIETRVSNTLGKRFEIDAAGAIKFNESYTFPTADGSSNQVLVTNGSGVLSFADISSLGSFAITFVGDDSTGTAVSGGETFRIAGTGGITTTVVGDTITIDGSSVSGGSIGDLSVIGSTITSPSNANLTLSTAGTGIIDLDANRVNIGSDYSSLYLGSYERYEYGLASLTEETLDLGTFPNKDSVYGNTLGTKITLDQTDPGSLTTNQWKGLRVELITDVNGRAVTSYNQVNGIRSYNGGANALSVLNQFRNNNVINPDHTLVESAGISILTNFAHDNSVAAKTTITDYSSVVTNLDTAFSTGTAEITNHYQFLANGSRKSNSAGTGTLTNEYGLYIKNQSVATNNYGIYVENESFINRIGGLQITSRNITTTESNQDITIDPNGSGYVYLSGFRFPNTDGTSNQVLTTNGAGVISFTTPNVITMVGDDSTGATVRMGEIFKIAGGTNITTAVSGDTLTITGSPSITINSIESADSTAIQINDAVNISGNLSANTIDTNQIGSGDSSAIQITDSINVAGNVTGSGAGSFGGNLTVGGNASIAGNITIDGTLNSTGTLTSNVFVVNEISSDDSSAIQINDSVNVSGTLTVGSLVASTISPPSTLTGTYTISSPTTITLSPTDEVINTAPMKLVNKTVSQLTTSPGVTASTGAMVYCTDDVDGGVPAFFDGINWRRITDRAVVTT